MSEAMYIYLTAICILWFWSVSTFPKIEDVYYKSLRKRAAITAHACFAVCLFNCLSSSSVEALDYSHFNKFGASLTLGLFTWIATAHVPYGDTKISFSSKNKLAFGAGLFCVSVAFVFIFESLSTISTLFAVLIAHRFQSGNAHLHEVTAHNMIRMQEKVDALDAHLTLEKALSKQADSDNLGQAG